MKGGARASSGPAPDPNSRRQQTKAQASGWIDLPSGGRDDDAPPWPLAQCSDAELSVWTDLWSKPQAVAWESLNVDVRLVALYVRRSVEAELDIKASTEARQLGALLGLDPQSMLRNKWRIKGDDLEQKRTEKAAPTRRRSLKVADAVGT